MQFLLYCICGGVGVVSDFLVYYLLFSIGISYQIANAFGYLLGTIVSFILNRSITFGITNKTTQRLASFLLVAFGGYLVSAGLLWLLIALFHTDARYAKLFTLPTVVILQFSLNRWLTFRPDHNLPHPK